ncbi:hypothetical protein [Methylobacter tundripaludum]|nr:hypothetical protein [Methylobacter tundripaludum]
MDGDTETDGKYHHRRLLSLGGVCRKRLFSLSLEPAYFGLQS